MCPLHQIAVRFASIAIFVGAFLAGDLSPQVRYGVEEVIDGESLRIAGIGTVRLLGVDVPKRIEALRPWSPDTDAVVLFLRSFIAALRVALEYDTVRADGATSALAYVYLPNGTCLNAEVLKRGLGRLNSELPFRRLEEFRGYEREAQAAGRGLWAQATAADVPQQAAPPDTAVPRPPSRLIIR